MRQKMSTKSILLLCCCYISDVSFPQWRMTGCCWLAVCRSLALSEGKQTPRNLSKQPRVTQDNVGSLACQCTVGKHVWTLSWKPVTTAIVYNAAKLTRYWSKDWPIITIVFWYILRNISVCVNLFYPKFAWPTLFHSAVWFHSRLKTGEAQDGMKMRMYSQQGKTWHSWVMLYRLWQSCIVMLLKSPPRTPYQQPHIYTIQCLKLKLFVFLSVYLHPKCISRFIIQHYYWTFPLMHSS